MATLTGSTTLNTVFTPAAGDFDVQISGGFASLLRRQTAGADWVAIPGSLSGPYIISNPVDGVDYMFTSPQAVAVQADQ